MEILQLIIQYIKNNKKSVTTIMLSFVVFILILSLFFKIGGGVLKKACEAYLEDSSQNYSREGRIVSVEAAVVKSGTMTKRISSVGKLRANASVLIKSEISGRIKELSFTEGASVKKGQEIIKFEDEDLKAELREAQANLALTKSNFERTAKIYDQRLGSAKDYDKAKAELEAAEARVEVGKSRLSKTVIKAPFDGTIGLIDVSVGAYVQQAQELVTIVDTSPIKIDFKVPEKFVHDVGVGQTAEIRVDAFKDQVFEATIEAVDAKIDLDSHSLTLRGSIPNDENLLRVGLFANVSLIVGEKGNTIMVDETSIDRQGTIEFVWVIEKGKARQKPVRTGVREKQMVEIVSGLNSGEVVVTAGQMRLQNGSRVKILNMPETGETSEATNDQKGQEKKPEALVSENNAEKTSEKLVDTKKDEPVKTESTSQEEKKASPSKE